MARVALEALTKDEQYKHDCRKAEDLIHSKHYSFSLPLQGQVPGIVEEFNRCLVHEYPRTTCIISSVVVHARADGLYMMRFVFTERTVVLYSACAEQVRRSANDRSIYPEYTPDDFYERAKLIEHHQRMSNYEHAKMQARILESLYEPQQENI